MSYGPWGRGDSDTAESAKHGAAGLTKDLCAEKPGMTESGPHGGQRRVLQRGKAVSRRRSRCYCDRSSSGLRDQDMLAEKNVAVACECIPSEGHSWWI